MPKIDSNTLVQGWIANEILNWLPFAKGLWFLHKEEIRQSICLYQIVKALRHMQLRPA